MKHSVILAALLLAAPAIAQMPAPVAIQTPAQPDPARATGATVIVAPGGGFMLLAPEGKRDERPAFIGYISGPMLAADIQADAPPMLAAITVDNAEFGDQSYDMVDAWRRASRPAELHAYERGGHGFGAGKPGAP